MPAIPFYDPDKTFEENFDHGPFGAFADGEIYSEPGEPTEQFLGIPVHLPFGISAGPLLNSKFVKAAFAKGFDIAVYKTVRTRIHPAHPWPNVLPVAVADRVLPGGQKLQAKAGNFEGQVSITNSFGVPSYNPDFWQKDISEAAGSAGKGQVLVASFQGSLSENGDVGAFVEDFALAAKLLTKTGAKALEANLSCPNEGSDLLLCFDIARTRQVVEAIKRETGDVPLIVKIAYFPDKDLLEKLLREIGGYIAAVAAVNAITATVVDEKGGQALPGKGRMKSGVAGAGIKWAGLEMAASLGRLREKLGLDFEIIGIGGLSTPEDYREYRKAGADSALAATAAMWNPYLAQDVKKLWKDSQK